MNLVKVGVFALMAVCFVGNGLADGTPLCVTNESPAWVQVGGGPCASAAGSQLPVKYALPEGTGESASEQVGDFVFNQSFVN